MTAAASKWNRRWTSLAILAGAAPGSQFSCRAETAALRTSISTPARIDSFKGEYRFLSNFCPAEVHFEGMVFPSAEHAYQAAKSLDLADRRRIAACPTASEAKKAGRPLKSRPDWKTAKFVVMETIVRDKFTRNADLKVKLLDTGDAELIEGNTWGDRVWGVYQGQGENHLGRILMKIRADLRERRSPPASGPASSGN